jgi:ferric-dicitrate binding protein FerR (iron transport regulator)
LDRTQDNQNRIRELYALYTESRATEAELAEFFALADEPANEEIFRELFGGTWDELQLADPHNRQLPKTLKIGVFTRWAAAAAVLLVLFSGTYFLLNRKSGAEQTPIVQTKKPTDIAPGGNRAVLTLSNGSKIILDSARNGLLAKQSGSSVIKTNIGRIAYQNNSGEKVKSAEVVYNTLTTPRGGQYQLELPDGTKVWLNAASSITYPSSFAGGKRKVSITGEIYFEVAHNPAKPFQVSVNNIVVEVLGTHFNVNAYSDEKSINTTLLEGSVKIRNIINSQMLKPGQQAQVVDQQISVVNNVDIDQAVAWKEGTFYFENADIKTILRQFSRWYDVDVVYEGPVANKKFFAIVSRNTSLKRVLDLLQHNNIVYQIDGKKLIIKTN